MADPTAVTGRPSPDERRAHRTLGAPIGALGALGVAASAYLDWYADLTPTQIPLRRLFDTEVAGAAGSYWTSLAAPLALVGLIGVLGGLLRSRALIAVAGALGVTTLVVWILMQAIDLSPDELTASDYQVGLWVCVVSLVLLFVGVAVMGRRDPAAVPPPDEPAALDTAHRPTEV